MQIIWEEIDIQVGKFVHKLPESFKKDQRFNPDSWTAKWTFQIGWNATADSKKGRFVLINIADGMVTKTYTAKALAESLTQDGMVPMRYSYLQATIEYLRDRIA